jgi:hypothetical protein
VNTNNATVSDVFGYNNNVCIGSINTLYYCTLYTSKSNQEDETYPYVKALEAVASRLKRIQENESEDNLSSRQVGLRHLLSGISSHISSCVVSATMAWYLVTHGTRFHFSHDLKPLLLSQFEAWYLDNNYSQRIRYRKNKRNRGSGTRNSSDTSPNEGGENTEESDVWLDSSVSNYIFRPACHNDIFSNMCLWEYESKYDMIIFKPENFMAAEEVEDLMGERFRFHHHHPGVEYCTLIRRKHESVPKLYYSNKFPDIEMLEIHKGDEVEDHVKELRETYALKSMLMFFPFETKTDLKKHHSSLWNSFQFEKMKLINHLVSGTPLMAPSLYTHTLQILQNIQDLINIKKVPNGEEALESCTTICEAEVLYEHTNNHIRNDNDFMEEEDDFIDVETQIQQLSEYVNILSEDGSIFNGNNESVKNTREIALHPSIVSIKSSTIESNMEDNVIDELTNDIVMSAGETETHHRNRENSITSIVTVMTRALESNDLHLFRQQIGPAVEGNVTNPTVGRIDSAICSLALFAAQNKLDGKQTVAFKAICSSFMLSFLNDTTLEVTIEEKERLQSMLQKHGAMEQLLMCVTGPGGSGKSHVIKCCRLYCKLFCDAVGKPFNFSVFPITATTNSAAALLQGSTIHSAAILNKSNVQLEMSTDVNWTMTRVLIIDEISLADKNLFKSLDRNLKILTGNKRLLYGGIHIIFTGDFMQLPPVQGTPIYKDFEDFFWHQSLNSAIFLDECNHRFINDPRWGDMLQRIQVGSPTDEDIKVMNQRLLGKVTLPNIVDCNEINIAYGCYTNKKRNQLTDACFLKFVSDNNPPYNSNISAPSDTLIIKCYVTKKNRDVGPEFHKLLWALCGDDNLSVGTTHKVDPCLKMIKGCPVMVITNTEKGRRIVKGTKANFIGVRWKHGCCAHVEDYNGFKVNSAHITDIDCIILKLQSDGRHVELQSEMFYPSIKFHGCNNKNQLKGYHVLQFPINLCLAITGHKLQGMTVDIMILSEIYLKQNWLYVMLSRVTTLQGLYLMKPLSKEMFKPISQNLKKELLWLRQLERQLLQRISPATST